MRNTLLIALSLVFLNLLIFSQTRDFDFISYDDPGHVLDRPELRQGLTPEGIRWAFTTTFVGNYIPITGLTFLADHSLHGLQPGGYHLTNLLFHIANTLLLFAFFTRTTSALWPSALIAALFAIHPLHVESVAWISARKDVVSTLFWLLTLLCYASYAKRPRGFTYSATAILLFIGLFAKPMLVTVPCVLLLLDIWPLRRVEFVGLLAPENRAVVQRLLLEKIPLFVPVILASAITLSIQRQSGAISSTDILFIGQRLANALVAYSTYIGRTLWPSDLIPFYPHPVGGLPLWIVIASAAFLITATVLAIALSKDRPWLPVGWFWYLGTLVPVIGLVQVGAQATADRYTYVSMIGLLIVAAFSLAEVTRTFPKAKLPIVAATLCVLFTLSWATHSQTARWKDTETLFTYTARVESDSLLAHSSLGKFYLEQKDYSSARDHLERAVQIRPSYPPALLNLGIVEAHEGRLDLALAAYRKILQSRPNHLDARNNIASVLIRQGKPTQAITHLETTLELNPDHTDALTNLGAAYLLLGRPERALPHLKRAEPLAPEDEVLQLNLAVAYHDLDEPEKAREYCRHAIAINPDYEKAKEFLALLNSRG